MLRLFSLMMWCGSSLVATAAEKTPELYTLPEWYSLDDIDRKYSDKVSCQFHATAYRQARWGHRITWEFLLDEPEDKKTASAPTWGEALNQSCNACMDGLREKHAKLNKRRVPENYKMNCYFHQCSAGSRQLSLERRTFDLAIARNKDREAARFCTASSDKVRTDPENVTTYYKVFSRPNDDSFQNEKGEEANGEPYEVAIMYGGLVLKKDKSKKEIALSFDWKSEITTGRQVEAGKFICMHEAANNIPGEKPKTIVGEEADEKHVPLKIVYPRGVTEESWFEEKPGSVLSASLPLGKVWNGSFSGKLFVRGTRRGRGRPAMDGLPAIPPSKSTLGGIIKIIEWSLTLKDGNVVNVDFTIVRSHNDPPLRLVDSNFVSVARDLHEHQHYFQQEKRQICGSEQVGDGDLPTAESSADALTRQAGELVKQAGCLDCHGEGAADDKFRFCDSGVSIRPREDAAKLYSMILHGVPKNKPGREPYPDEMFQAVAKLRQLDQEKGIIASWAKIQNQNGENATP